MSPAFSPTRYVISTRRKAKRELLLLPAMNETIGQLDQPECCLTFQRENCIDISEFESHLWPVTQLVSVSHVWVAELCVSEAGDALPKFGI